MRQKMVDYKKSALSDVIGLLWKELKLSQALKETDYPIASGSRVIPIFPVQEEETKNLLEDPNAPYIVYDFDLLSYDTDWVICKERITFKIYSKNMSKVLEIMNVMLDLFRRFDESAKTVNSYVKETNPNSPFNYNYFSLTDATSPDPADELAGRLEADISIIYAYTRDLNMEGRFA
jgi:hypothetical protein